MVIVDGLVYIEEYDPSSLTLDSDFDLYYIVIIQLLLIWLLFYVVIMIKLRWIIGL